MITHKPIHDQYLLSSTYHHIQTTNEMTQDMINYAGLIHSPVQQETNNQSYTNFSLIQITSFYTLVAFCIIFNLNLMILYFVAVMCKLHYSLLYAGHIMTTNPILLIIELCKKLEIT